MTGTANGARSTSTMLWTIDTGAATPLREQIASCVRRAIAGRELDVGDPLPPAAELAEAIGVDRNTVLAAYRQLRDHGVLEFRRGRGVRVATAEPPEPAVVAAATTLVDLGREHRDDLIQLIRELHERGARDLSGRPQLAGDRLSTARRAARGDGSAAGSWLAAGFLVPLAIVVWRRRQPADGVERQGDRREQRRHRALRRVRVAPLPLPDQPHPRCGGGEDPVVEVGVGHLLVARLGLCSPCAPVRRCS